MEFETPLKDGYLLLPPHGVIKKKSWQKKYCKLFKASKFGIERLEVYDSEEDCLKNKSSNIITLENCVKISHYPQKHQANVFQVVTKNSVVVLATLFDQEMHDWISAIQQVAFKEDLMSCMNHSMSSSTFSMAGPMLDELEEDNDLYCSSGEGIYTVRVVPTDASLRCGLSDGNYTLVVTPNALQLRVPYPQEHVLFTWPFMYIRRYGYRSGLFTFEAGRKCDSGEGVFQLENGQQQEIFKFISLSMRNWKISRKEESPISPHPPSLPSPAIMCGDEQFQAALSMEPGSRTPLPPSPTSATARLYKELNNSLTLDTTQAKSKPTKPPRKGLVKGGLSVQDVIDPVLLKKLMPDQNFDKDSFAQSYDTVAVRQDAWKTMGVTELTHTETVVDDGKCKLIKPLPTPPHQKDLIQQLSRKIITQPCVESTENYDTLQHFGSSQPMSVRSNSLTKSQYRQITPQGTMNTAPPVPSPVSARQKSYDDSFNEYDFIQEPLGNAPEACRPADDSHQGYGMIRKPVPPLPPQNNATVDIEYAIVVKKK